MPKVKLNVKNLETLPPPPEGRADYRDEVQRGLVLRVSNTARVFVCEYARAGATKRYRVGDLKDWTLAAARAEVRRIRAEVDQGHDPLDQRRQREQDQQTADGERFADLGGRALADLERTLRPRTISEWRRLLKVEIVPRMGEVNAQDPRAVRRAALEMGDEIAKRAPYVANRAIELARRIISWAVATDRSDRYTVNPLLRVAKPLKAEAIRTRTYTADEVRRIVAGAEGTGYGDVLPMLLATGTRIGEAIMATWAEIDLESNSWNIPAGNSKIRHDRPVALNAPALAVLARLRARGAGSPFLFPAATASGHVERNQKFVSQIRKRSGVADFEAHDLRRVVRSGLANLGVPSDVAELCLGHLPSKLVRTYAPHPVFWRMADQRKAMAAWGAMLEGMLAGETRTANVLPMLRG